MVRIPFIHRNACFISSTHGFLDSSKINRFLAYFYSTKEAFLPYFKLLLSCPSRREGIKVARARDRLDFYTIDGDTTYLDLHNLGMELEEREIFSSPFVPVVSAATTHKTFGPIDLSSTYSVCTRRVFGGIRHRTQALRSGVPML
ncbi:hypothetical protein TNCV_3761051 [Trichonephila clavipes]|nr:hypothetical protein TNCV_3761051 [Trichonephila clavipes]